MAPICIRRLAQLVFSCTPTSAASETSFKQRSRVHSRIRNRLSGDNADKTSAILFNGQQIKRVAAGVLAQPQVCVLESRILDAIVSGALAPAVGVVVGDDNDTGAEIAGESGLQGVDGVELGGAAISDSIALADVEAVLVSMLAEDDV
jgi:hAT family C-terminal dimerisation region